MVVLPGRRARASSLALPQIQFFFFSQSKGFFFLKKKTPAIAQYGNGTKRGHCTACNGDSPKAR